MNYFKTIIIVLVFTLLFACKKEAKSPDFIDKPVIQAYLQAGQIASVNVSHLIPFAADAQYSSDDLNNLQISISTNNVNYPLQSIGNGSYSATSASLIVTEGATYNLNLLYNNKNVTATTIIPPKPTGYTQSVITMSISPRHSGGGGFSSGSLSPDPVKLTWTNSDNSYYLVLAEVIATNAPLIDTTAGAVARSFRTSPVQSNTSQLSFRQFQYYGMHRLILYHLNPDYATLYSASSNNSNNLTNSTTSVINGAGIFTGTNTDTLFIDILKP